MKLNLLAHLTIATLLASSAVYAQDADDPFVELVDVLTSPDLIADGTDSFFRSVSRQYAADPDIAYLEEECPQSIALMVGIMREELLRNQEANLAEYRDRLADLFRTELPRDQAMDATAFYKSAFGQQLIRKVSTGRNYDATVRSAIDSEGEVDAKAVSDDNSRNISSVIRQIEPTELYEQNLDLGTREWPKTMLRIRPKMEQLQTEFLNADPEPGMEEAVEERISTELQAHLKVCGF